MTTSTYFKHKFYLKHSIGIINYFPSLEKFGEFCGRSAEEKNINILSNFTETFQKFKKSYLSRNGSDVKQAPSKVKKITTLENWTTIMKESKKKQKESEEAPSASAAQEKQSEIKEETCLNNNVRTDNPGKKAIHEKFVVTENYHYKKVKTITSIGRPPPNQTLKPSIVLIFFMFGF